MLAALQNAKKGMNANPRSKVTGFIREEKLDDLKQLFAGMKQEELNELFKKTNPEGDYILHEVVSSLPIAKGVVKYVYDELGQEVLARLLQEENRKRKTPYELILQSNFATSNRQIHNDLVELCFKAVDDVDTRLPYVMRYLMDSPKNNEAWLKKNMDLIPVEILPSMIADASSSQLKNSLLENFKKRVGELSKKSHCIPNLIVESQSDEILELLVDPFFRSPERKESAHELLCFACGVMHTRFSGEPNPSLLNTLLMRFKLDVNTPNADGTTVLLSLLQHYSDVHRAQVEQIIKCGAKINVFDKHGISPLHAIVLRGDLDLLKFFLQLVPNADLNMKLERKPHPCPSIASLIDCAASCTRFYQDELKRLALLNFLFENGAKIAANSSCIAALCNNRTSDPNGCVTLLLEKGADPNVRYINPQNEQTSVPGIDKYYQSPSEFIPDSALGSILHFDKTIPHKGIPSFATKLLQHKATLSPREMQYYLGMQSRVEMNDPDKSKNYIFGIHGKTNLIAVAKEQHEKQLVPSRPQTMPFADNVFDDLVQFLDAESFRHLMQTCSYLRAKYDNDKHWMDLLERDYPGEKHRLPATYLKYRYGILKSRKCQIFSKISARVVQDGADEIERKYEANINGNPGTLILPHPGKKFEYVIKSPENSYNDGFIYTFKGSAKKEKLYIALLVEKVEYTSWCRDSGGSYSSYDRDLMVVYKRQNGGVLIDGRLIHETDLKTKQIFEL